MIPGYSTTVITLGISIGVAFGVGSLVQRFGVGKSVERTGVVKCADLLSVIVLGALLVARAAFVIGHWHAYVPVPWSIFDITDGGFNPYAGVIAVAVIATQYSVRYPRSRRPMFSAILAGMTAWIIGTIAVFMTHGDPIKLPAATFANMEGGETHISSLVGTPVVLNLWATWCGPCRRELPVLQQAQQRSNDVVYLFADQRESRDAVRRYLEGQGLVLRNVLLDDAGKLGQYANSDALPTTLFFDAKGDLVDVRVGPLSAGSLDYYLSELRSVSAHGPGQRAPK